MVLLDHFHPPLSTRRHWHAFHNAWATYISSDLNQRLPQGYFAEPNVQFGIEIDVAAFEETINTNVDLSIDTQSEWKPPKPSQTLPFQPTAEAVEISIFNSEAGPILAGAIELVSPANKDRPSHQDAFVAKCQTYLQQGIGLVVVDVVTSRKANLHDTLMAKIGEISLQASKETAVSSLGAALSAVAYRVVERSGQSNLDIWLEHFSIGDSLPTLPLWLHGGLCLPVELNTTYERTCREQRIILDHV
ncbi:MAG: DUF4058 family protein [Scytonema sp. PMC 1069.18]|nr:DUF4058 family protein [Scytonema sp. PMC 1069.18]MEC4880206.1 DUF4058 family protein [Scytonema sp. PMC 1070.18]